MKERQILYKGPMVRAILAGEKTQTRRVVIPTQTPPRVAPLRMEPWIINGQQETDDQGLPCWAGYHPDYPGEAKWFSCPYGKPGDQLWVREAWQARSPRGIEWTTYKPSEREGYAPADWTVRYAATDENFAEWSGWNPSIHMPRWASRITQTITDVRVERVGDITEADAQAEGVLEWARSHCSRDPEDELHAWAYFELMWNSVNKSDYCWDMNPFVWVITFETLIG